MAKDYSSFRREWDRQSEGIWAEYQSHYSPGEEMLIEVSYLNLTAGYVRIKTNPMPMMGESLFITLVRISSLQNTILISTNLMTGFRSFGTL